MRAPGASLSKEGVSIKASRRSTETALSRLLRCLASERPFAAIRGPRIHNHAGAHHGWWCRNLLRDTAGAATKSMAVSASVDRVPLAGPSAAAPHACQDKPAMRRGGAYRCWKSATTVERDSTAGDYAHGGRIGERRASKTNARVGLRWCLLPRKSACSAMRRGDAYWCHLSAKSLAISTNGLLRSESRIAETMLLPRYVHGDWDGGMFPLAPPAARQDQAGQSVVHKFTTGLELNKIAIG